MKNITQFYQVHNLYNLSIFNYFLITSICFCRDPIYQLPLPGLRKIRMIYNRQDAEHPLRSRIWLGYYIQLMEISVRISKNRNDTETIAV